MGKSFKHMILAVSAFVFLSGCAFYPVVQVAGGVWTGYDAVQLADEYLPRTSIKGGEHSYEQDKVLQRRLRERLQMNGMSVSAHVIGADAYMVGQVKDQQHADYAIDTAATVGGIKTIVCKFYPQDTPQQAGEDLRLQTELNLRLSAIKRLKTMDLRVEVIQNEAILIGKASTPGQKSEAVAVASEVAGIKDVVNYIKLPDLPENNVSPNTVASK